MGFSREIVTATVIGGYVGRWVGRWYNRKKIRKKKRRGFELTLLASSDVEKEGCTSHGRGLDMRNCCCMSVSYGSEAYMCTLYTAV